MAPPKAQDRPGDATSPRDRPGDPTGARAAALLPRLRLRESAAELLALPWERPLAEWSADDHEFREFPIGPSRHLVRFLLAGDVTYALKELPLRAGLHEYEILRRLESMSLPAVTAVGIVEAAGRGESIVVTEYLTHSMQYRLLMMRLPLGPGPYRDRLLDAMAWLLVDLHRSGVYWGDCSLANTLFRRDGDKIQAYLVDAETSEVHPSLSDGQRAYDLEILVENVAFGLADLAALQGADDLDDAAAAAETVRERYLALWHELHLEPTLAPHDRHAVHARVRRMNELGFAVDEITLEPTPDGAEMHLRLAISNRQFHARELQRRTGLVALEGQARLLLNDLREYQAWLEYFDKRPMGDAEGAGRWLTDVLEPSLRRLAPSIGPTRDPIQAYCDVLEEKWILSEAAGRDVGLQASIDAYLERGAPAPEDPDALPAASIALEIDWSAGFETPPDRPPRSVIDRGDP